MEFNKSFLKLLLFKDHYQENEKASQRLGKKNVFETPVSNNHRLYFKNS